MKKIGSILLYVTANCDRGVADFGIAYLNGHINITTYFEGLLELYNEKGAEILLFGTPTTGVDCGELGMLIVDLHE